MPTTILTANNSGNYTSSQTHKEGEKKNRKKSGISLGFQFTLILLAHQHLNENMSLQSKKENLWMGEQLKREGYDGYDSLGQEPHNSSGGKEEEKQGFL